MAFWVASYLQEYWSAVETNDVVVSNMVLHLAERQEGVLHSAWIPPPSGSCKLMSMVLFFPQRSWLALM